MSEIKQDIDLKPEAVSTLLYHLESDFYNDSGPLLIYHGDFYQYAYLRFYTHKAEDVKNMSEFLKALIETSHQHSGVYRVNIPKLGKVL